MLKKIKTVIPHDQTSVHKVRSCYDSNKNIVGKYNAFDSSPQIQQVRFAACQRIRCTRNKKYDGHCYQQHACCYGVDCLNAIKIVQETCNVYHRATAINV